MRKGAYFAASVAASLSMGCTSSVREHADALPVESVSAPDPDAFIVRRDPAQITLTRAALSATADLVGRTRSSRLDIDMEVSGWPRAQPLAVTSPLHFDRCIFDNGIDAAPYLEVDSAKIVATAGYGMPSGNPSLFAHRLMRASCVNLPPHPYRSITVLTGHIETEVSTDTQVLVVDLVDGAVATPVPGWTLAMHGTYTPATKRFVGSVDIRATEATGLEPLDPRRLISASVETPGWPKDAVKVEGVRVAIPGGVRFEFQAHWNAWERDFTPAPSKASIKFVTAVERRAVPFEFHDVLLAR